MRGWVRLSCLLLLCANCVPIPLDHRCPAVDVRVSERQAKRRMMNPSFRHESQHLHPAERKEAARHRMVNAVPPPVTLMLAARLDCSD